MQKPFELPGLYRYEYVAIIELPNELRGRIEQLREELTRRYQMVQPEPGRAIIALVRFSAIRTTEEKIVNRLRQIAGAEKPFVIELEDYGGYPMHAIFIRIANQQRILQLIKNLKKARALMKAGGEDPHFLQDPNIVLAGRIEKEKYRDAITAYEQKRFKAQFMAASFLLLKRPQHEKKYQVVKRFQFEGIPVSVGQGVLFT